MAQTLRFTLWDYALDDDIKPIVKETGKRFVDTDEGWAKFKKQAPQLMMKTAKYWSWFDNDKFDIEEVSDEKEKCVHFSLSGEPNMEYHRTEDDPIQSWLGLVGYQIEGKGTHEQFKEADLLDNTAAMLEMLCANPQHADEEQSTIIIQIYLKNEIDERYRT